MAKYVRLLDAISIVRGPHAVSLEKLPRAEAHQGQQRPSTHGDSVASFDGASGQRVP
jgi:hypothetical protein